MDKLNKKLNLVKARRRVRMRSALSLTLGVCYVMKEYRFFITLNCAGGFAPERIFGWTLAVLVTLLCFGGGAYLGLCVLDGDQTKILPRRALSRAQVLWLALTGVLVICPMALASDVLESLQRGARVVVQPDSSPVRICLLTAMSSVRSFLLIVMKSGLLAPVLEELFFRGYLLHALERYGKGRALAASALCFGMVHLGGKGGLGYGALLLYAPLGLLLGVLTMKTGSLIAPMLVHAGYNLALIFASEMGLSALLTGLAPLSCALRLAGCLAFVYCLRRAWTARGTAAQLQKLEKLTKRERALVAAAVLLAMVLSMME